MRIYTPNGDLAFKTFTFPDGQPHFKLELYERKSDVVTIETSIKSPLELLAVCLAIDVLRGQGFSEINLDVRYLMAARMDRAIDTFQPYTLQSVARILNSCGFSRVRILDVHSEVSTRLIRNSVNILPFEAVKQVRKALDYPFIACPDKGARHRVTTLCSGYHVQCSKVRDMQTGELRSFDIENHGVNSLLYKDVLIVDDICDGGGTFIGLAKVLRAAGAKKVYLYVTHGIFSKGPDALFAEIDAVFTTDSYCDGNFGYVPVVPVTILPVSMKEM